MSQTINSLATTPETILKFNLHLSGSVIFSIVYENIKVTRMSNAFFLIGQLSSSTTNHLASQMSVILLRSSLKHPTCRYFISNWSTRRINRIDRQMLLYKLTMYPAITYELQH